MNTQINVNQFLLKVKEDPEYNIGYVFTKEEAEAVDINKLEKFPKRFPLYKENFRFMPVDNYLVFYTIDEDSMTISILRVMYGRCDIESRL